MPGCNGRSKERRRATPLATSTSGRRERGRGPQEADPDDLPKVVDAPASRVKTAPSARPVYLFFISGAKEHNPSAAQALIERLK